jgi:hypothetical protein
MGLDMMRLKANDEKANAEIPLVGRYFPLPILVSRRK